MTQEDESSGADRVEFSEIMDDIMSKLTGEREKDLNYLLSVRDVYKFHVYANEIIRAVGIKIFSLLTPQQLKDFQAAQAQKELTEEMYLNEAKQRIKEGKLDEAEVLIKEMIPKIDMFAEDQVTIYLSFSEPMERELYLHFFKPEKEVSTNYQVKQEVFLTYAYILIERGMFEEAMQVLDRGLGYNPLNLLLLYEKSEIFKLKQDWDNFKMITDTCMKYSFRVTQLARGYRNYGYMFIELKDYEAAICCYLQSNVFTTSKHAKSQIDYIETRLKIGINPLDYHGKIETVLSQRGIPTGPNQDIIILASKLAQNCEENGDIEKSRYFYDIVARLTRGVLPGQRMEH